MPTDIGGQLPTPEHVIAHVQKNARELDLVNMQYTLGAWWVQLTKGDVKSRPAVHKNLVDAYAIALANFTEIQPPKKV
jgi:hypothetical protein